MIVPARNASMLILAVAEAPKLAATGGGGPKRVVVMGGRVVVWGLSGGGAMGFPISHGP